jgi:prepilin-type processing-associated H-X9-DG protein
MAPYTVSAAYKEPTAPANLRVQSWLVLLLPYVEQDSLYRQLPLNPKDPAKAALFGVPENDLSSTQIPIYVCPSDPRGPVQTPGGGSWRRAAATYYAAVGGTDTASPSWPLSDGVIFWRSRVNLEQIQDGTSNTLAAGERPPSGLPSVAFGWWHSVDTYDTRRFLPTNELDTVQYMTNTTPSPAQTTTPTSGVACPPPAGYGPGHIDNDCDVNHFWSNHTDGANFVFCDGGVRFVPYSARPIMNALATRSNGEVADPTGY